MVAQRLFISGLELWLAACSSLLAADVPAGFEHTLFVGGLGSPTSMTFAPDGRLFVSDKYGKLMIVKNGKLLTTPFLEVEVVQDGERGLQGIAFDPNFAANRYLYVFYTYAVGPSNRISRFRASATNPDLVEDGSEVVLVDNIASAIFHNGGSLHFGIDGKLYASTGDAQQTGYSQNLSRLEGKILRLDPAAYPNIIPPDNPFVSTSGARGEIWARGLRNPFTFAIDPVTGKMFINDVGAGGWEEANLGVKGANYGWPSCEGICSNQNFQNPVFTYDHTVGEAITGAVFYRANQFPTEYVGDYFFADYTGNWIRRIDASDNNQVTIFATNVNKGPIDLDVGPDGNLYYLSLSTSSTDPAKYDGKIFKISYVGDGNHSPVAVATANPTSGLPPLLVNFNGDGSSDLDGDVLTYSWNFGDGSVLQSGVNVSHTYAARGQYTAKLTVDDGNGGADDSDDLLITVGNAPVGAITAPLDGALYAAGDMIHYSGTATDVEDDVLPASAFSWTIIFHHSTHTHPFLGPIDGVMSGSFTIPRTGETADDVFYRISLTAIDSDGIKHVSTRDILPRKSNFTLASDPSGLLIDLDGQPKTTPLPIVGVVGMTRAISAPSPQALNGATYEFVSWSDGGAQPHSFDTPETNTTYLATYQVSSGGSTLSFLPSDDAYVKSSSPTTSYGSLNTLRLRKSGSETINSYLKFGVTGLSGQVQSAKLRLYVTNASSDGGAVYSVSNNYQSATTAWTQGGLNWNNAPAISGSALNSVGPVSVGMWVEFDVTTTIAANGTYSFGLKNNVSDVVYYGSKEGTNKPELLIQVASGSSLTPSVTSFNPSSGSVGTEVIMSGNNFTGTTSVKFNSTAATVFTVVSDAEIRATVPTGATTGKISVTTANGTAYSATDFVVNDSSGSAMVTFLPTHDAYVKSSSPTSSYGSTATLRQRKSSSETINSYLKFEVAGLIGVVQSAKLRLYVTDASSDGGTVYTVSNNYQETTNAWTQSALNWNNAPAISGTALSSAGAVTLNTWVEFEVTAAISGNGTFSFGLKNNASDVVYYSSKEGANKPELVVQGSFSTQAISAAAEEGPLAPLPEKFALHQNYPNPFNPETRIAYDLAESADVRLSVYNILGQQVVLLVEEEQAAGYHTKVWDGRNKNGQPQSSGIYFYRLQAGGYHAARKMLLLP